jgi:uncharacterized membrane protein (UPF0127 family)
MKLPHWLLPGLQRGLAQRRQAEADLRFRVLNLDRQTVLASNMEVADSGAKRSKGLLGRKGLAPGGGLWIVPCESVHTFGMQFAIDLVYLDRQRRIRKIRNSVPPWRLSACLSAHSILELPSGSVAGTGSQRGDRLEFSDASNPLNVIR